MTQRLPVLLVEDDEMSVEILRATLSDAGYEVAVAGNGRQALDMVRAGSHRLVVSDWMMPEMDGLELCREIRRADLPSYIYVLLLTSRDGTQDVVDALSAGATTF